MVRFATPTFVSLLALTSCAFAHRTLTETLATRSELTSFVGLVSQYPDLVQSVSSSGGTILAPSNSALTAFIGKLGPQGLQGVSNDTIRALLTYHVLPETLNRDALAARGGGIAETSLSGPESFANLGDKANVVFASAYGSTGLEGSEAGPLRIYSGVGEPADVGASNLGYDGGVVHVINSVLNLPQNASTTAQTAGLTALVSALSTAELVEAVDTTPSVTIFAPTNEAFDALGVDLSTLSPTDLGEILKYHVIAGTVGYSSVLEEEQEVETLSGQSVRITKRDGKVFVNDAEVVQGNVILSNGVVHVINGVLTPPTDGASPSGSGSSGAGGASSTTRRPTDPTGTTAGAGAEQSNEPAEGEEGAARGLKASLFGALAVAGSALLASF
ncbi:FAS1 domain-containing protein [Coprinopsis sp. MPI-PUGE-AT-0042]|nr:FAS1 domain-containing protein [Coprinopsis sp. MPI-PUGE-AT-0042]